MNHISVAGHVANVRVLPPRDDQQDDHGMIAFSIADEGYRKGKKTVNWIQCKLMGKRVPSLQHFLHKGTFVSVHGIITAEEYTDKSGAKVKSFCVWVRDMKLQNTHRTDPAEGPRHAQGTERYSPTSDNVKPPREAPSAFPEEDDIPF